MKQLLGIAIRHKKHYALLIGTFLFMFLSTFAAQMEMLSIGVITRTGADFFSLFGDSESKQNGISLEQVEGQWDQIASPDGVITKSDASMYMSKKRDRNPLNRVITWIAGDSNWLQNMAILAGVLVFVAILKGVSFFGAQYTRGLVTIRVSRDLRQRYFEHMQTLSLDFYHKHSVGALSARIQGDAAGVAGAIYSCMVAFIQTPFLIISSGIMCFYVSWRLSILMFIGFPIAILPILYFSRKIKHLARGTQKVGEASSWVLLDFLSGVQTIKLFTMEQFAIKRFREQNDRAAEFAARGTRLGLLARPILHLFSTSMLALIILYGIYMARMPISEVLVFCGLVYVIYEPLKRLSDESLAIQQGLVAAERMHDVFKLKPKIADRPDAVDLDGFRDKIEFKNVWFRYGDEWVLKGLNFTAEKGQVVAFVGPTGAGKSTIAHLLPRLYEPEDGEILIDGKPLAAYTQKSLRQAIGFVPQKPFIFLDTVAANIAFGCDFPRDEIELAARRAHAEEYIVKLPDGFDTQLQEQGKNLSGGQQQRLAIARALVKKAPILIMDEATSSLDAVSENNIKEAIDELRGDVTQILIAHRLSTIEHADKIIFLDHGEVVAQGTKDELLQTCPAFRIMWDMMHGDKEKQLV